MVDSLTIHGSCFGKIDSWSFCLAKNSIREEGIYLPFKDFDVMTRELMISTYTKGNGHQIYIYIYKYTLEVKQADHYNEIAYWLKLLIINKSQTFKIRGVFSVQKTIESKWSTFKDSQGSYIYLNSYRYIYILIQSCKWSFISHLNLVSTGFLSSINPFY